MVSDDESCIKEEFEMQLVVIVELMSSTVKLVPPCRKTFKLVNLLATIVSMGNKKDTWICVDGLCEWILGDRVIIWEVKRHVNSSYFM